MNIKDYEYDQENFHNQALVALQKKEEADSKLIEIEEKQKASGSLSMDYYNAYLDYMTTDNAHMKTCLDYIKYYYDAMNFYGTGSINPSYKALADEAETLFDRYARYYKKLSKAESSYRQTLAQAEASTLMLNENQKYALIHMGLMECDRVHLEVHTIVENFRTKKVFPFFEKCEMLMPEAFDGEDKEPNA